LSFQALQTVMLRRNHDPDGVWHPTRIVDLTEGRELLVYAPVADGIEVEFPTEEKVVLETTLAQGIFRYVTRVRQRLPYDPPRLLLEWPEPMERIQRRDAVRVDVAVPVEMVAHVEGRRLRFHCRTSDLSVGGARLILPEPLPEETPVFLKVRQADRLEFACNGVVVRCGEIPGVPEGEDAVWAGVRFVDLSEGDRREVTRYLFDVERERLRSRLEIAREPGAE